MSSYIPDTLDVRQEKLAKIGLTDIKQLFSPVPENLLLKELKLPEGKTEPEVIEHITTMASKNKVFKEIYRGAGAYNHFIPSAVTNLASRNEFITGYTPYQAEISQGVLQSIFEYQTMICELTGMDSSNASVYDGGTAAGEAIIMCHDNKRNLVVVSGTTPDEVKEVMITYAHAVNMEIVIVPGENGLTCAEEIKKVMSDKVACVYIHQPNFYGLLEDAKKIAEIAHSFKAKFIMGVNPMVSTALKTPAELGADIAVGDGQPLGLGLAFGGPYLGFMACKKDMTRRLPGRIVGETVDRNNERAFVLTLQAREQHIRREKASSNICSNQAHCALTAAIYMSGMGFEGMRSIAESMYNKAHYLQKRLDEVGFKLKYDKPFFNEFLTTAPACPKEINKLLAEKDILGGYQIEIDGEQLILWCTTEMNSKESMDNLIKILAQGVKSL